MMRRELSDIILAVSQVTGISIPEITGKDKSMLYTRARHLVIQVAHEKFGHMKADIARAIKKDSSTVCHALTRLEGRIRWDEDFVRKHDAVLGALGHTGSAAKIYEEIMEQKPEERVHESGLTEAEVAECRKLERLGWSIFRLARRYDVSIQAIEKLTGRQVLVKERV